MSEHQDLCELIEDVSKFMDGYTLVRGMESGNSNYWPLLSHRDGHAFMFRSGCNDVPSGRVEISGRYPETNIYPDPSRKVIRVAIDRGPSVIAREITRRLLPTYVLEYARVLEHNERDRQQEARKQALVAKLSRASGCGVLFGNQVNLSSLHLGFHGDMIVHGADSVEIKLTHLSARQAVELARVLAKLPKQDDA